MLVFVTILHIVVSFILILVVLLQAGKGADMGAAFGGSSQTIFGSSGAGTFLGKMTAVVAAIFMITSLTLTYFSHTRVSSIMESVRPPAQQSTTESPKAPEAPAASTEEPSKPPDAKK